MLLAGGKVLGPGLVGKMNDNNSHVTIKFFMKIFILSTSAAFHCCPAHPLSKLIIAHKISGRAAGHLLKILVRDGVLYLDYHY
jgi:hypothetical protein